METPGSLIRILRPYPQNGEPRASHTARGPHSPNNEFSKVVVPEAGQPLPSPATSSKPYLRARNIKMRIFSPLRKPLQPHTFLTNKRTSTLSPLPPSQTRVECYRQKDCAEPLQSHPAPNLPAKPSLNAIHPQETQPPAFSTALAPSFTCSSPHSPSVSPSHRKSTDSSVVERLVYTELVGGSNPSPCTILLDRLSPTKRATLWGRPSAIGIIPW